MTDFALNLAGTRTSDRWAHHTGNIDPLNTATIWTNSDRHGIPLLDPTQFIPQRLAAWHNPKDREAAAGNGAIHFFLDDYRFENLWRKPADTYNRIGYVGAALTPDFSIWMDMPPVMQAWQLYRSRWLGAYWQHLGVEVIPTIRWAPTIVDMAVDSLPEGSVLAFSYVGLARHKDYVPELVDGFARIRESRRPTHLLWYGVEPPFDPAIPTTVYPSSWKRRGQRGERLQSQRQQNPQRGVALLSAGDREADAGAGVETR